MVCKRLMGYTRRTSDQCQELSFVNFKLQQVYPYVDAQARDIDHEADSIITFNFQVTNPTPPEQMENPCTGMHGSTRRASLTPALLFERGLVLFPDRHNGSLRTPFEFSGVSSPRSFWTKAKKGY